MPRGEQKEIADIVSEQLYKLQKPKKQKLLGKEFQVPQSNLGKAAEKYALLKLVAKRLPKDIKDAHEELADAFEEEKKNEITIQIGSDLFYMKEELVAEHRKINFRKEKFDEE